MVTTHLNQQGHHMWQSWWVGSMASCDPYFLSAGDIIDVQQRTPLGPTFHVVTGCAQYTNLSCLLMCTTWKSSSELNSS